MELEAEKAHSVVTIFTSHYQGGSAYNVRAEYLTKKGKQSYENKGWMNGEKVYYIYPKGINLTKVQFRETGYNTEFEGYFRCNDPFLNKMWEKSQRTLYITMRDTYMDCPDRERAQWWGDEVNESGEAFYALSVSSHLLMKKKGCMNSWGGSVLQEKSSLLSLRPTITLNFPVKCWRLSVTLVFGIII